MPYFLCLTADIFMCLPFLLLYDTVVSHSACGSCSLSCFPADITPSASIILALCRCFRPVSCTVSTEPSLMLKAGPVSVHISFESSLESGLKSRLHPTWYISKSSLQSSHGKAHSLFHLLRWTGPLTPQGFVSGSLQRQGKYLCHSAH